MGWDGMGWDGMGYLGRVREREVVVQLEVDKGEERLVQLEEGEHDSVVDRHGRLLRKVVRLDPGEGRALHLRLVVDPLDRDEDLADRSRAGEQRCRGERGAGW